MRNLVIFGIGNIGQLAHFYFEHDTDYQPVAFTVDAEYLRADEFCGLPVVPFNEISKRFPPADNDLFVAVSYAKLNQVRKTKFAQAKDLGYRLASYVSSRATVFPGFECGENCFILEDNTIQPFAAVGQNVTLWSGNHIGHHCSIGNDSFIASHVVVSGGVEIGESCFIGVNATIRDHVKIGARCVIAAGALILENADPDGVYAGNASERSRVPSSRIRL